MTTEQVKALQRYISATVYFMLHHKEGGGNILEYLAARKHLEATLGADFPVATTAADYQPPLSKQPKRDFPDLL